MFHLNITTIITMNNLMTVTHLSSKKVAATVSLVVLACCCSGIARASSFPSTTFYDENFFQNEWMHVPAGNNSTNATGRIVPGGIGAAAQQTTVVEGYSLISQVTYRTYHFWTSAAYVAATNGPLQRLDWDVWYRTGLGGHVLNLIAFQGDSTYMSPRAEVASAQDGIWQNHRVSVEAASFIKIAGNGPERIDSSTCGSPIIFGYVNYNDSGIRGPVDVGCPTGCLLPGGIFDLTLFKLTAVPSQEFKILGVQGHPNNTATISWESVPLNDYMLEYSSLGSEESWQPLLQRRATGCTDSITFRTDGLPRAFFRIRRL